MAAKIRITGLEKTEEYINREWASVAGRRQQMLASSDWTQLPDVGLSEGTVGEWRNWRAMVRKVSRKTHTLEEATQTLDAIEAVRPTNIYVE